MVKGYIVMFPVAIKCCKADDVRFYCNVPGRDQMSYGYIVTFLVEIKCCKAI